MELGVLGLSNNEIGIFLYQSEAEKTNQAIKPIFKYDYDINDPKFAIIITIFFPMIFLAFFLSFSYNISV